MHERDSKPDASADKNEDEENQGYKTDDTDDYSDSQKSDDDDGFETIDLRNQNAFGVVNNSKIDYRKYTYLVNRDDGSIASEHVIEETQLRKFQFLLGEIITDMGIKKGNWIKWVQTVLIAFIVLWLRMMVHYAG